MTIDTSFLPRRSRFDYGTGGDATTLTFQLPARAWVNREEAVGGRRIAAGGVGASYVVRRDEIISVPIRFRESDWPAVLDFVRWGQSEETFVWYPDALDLLTSFVVYLHAPAAGERVEPQRDSTFPQILELTVDLRRIDQPETAFGLDYYGLDG